MNKIIKILVEAAPTKMIMLAPLVFLLHVAEEAPGFVTWFNSLVHDGITRRSFFQVNLAALIITVITTVLAAISKDKLMIFLALAWLSLLMLANAIVHIMATIVHATYSPGTVTATLLYLPYFSWFACRTVIRYRIGIVALVTIVCLGSLPMLIHGYLIVFKGSRLF